MVGVINGVSTAIDIARKLKQSTDAVRDSETKLLVADLMNQLADLKITCSELVEENAELKKELKNIVANQSEGVMLIGDVYMSGNNGPFCTTCWDVRSKQVRLKEEVRDFQEITGHKYVCPICETRHKGEKN